MFSLLLYFLEDFVQNSYYFFLKCSIDQQCSIIPWSIICGKLFFMMYSINFVRINSGFLFYLNDLLICVFQGICLFHLSRCIYCYKFILIFPNFPFDLYSVYINIPSFNQILVFCISFLHNSGQKFINFIDLVKESVF